MKAIVKGAVIGGAGALLLGASLALSNAQVASSADRAQPEATFPSKIKCSKATARYCLTVQNRGSGNAMEGHASSGTGVLGQSKSSYGVYGKSSTSYGVYGSSPTAAGVDGGSSSGEGVQGISSSGTGVYGESSSGDGVYGISSSGAGVSGHSTSASGVDGSSNNFPGGFFQNSSSSWATLYALAGNSQGWPLWVENNSTGDSFSVNYDGDGDFTGSVTASVYYTAIRKRDGAHVETFGAESTRATLEDTGTARLTNGEGAVRFDSAFSGTIDAARGYQVFLTPDGDTRGLYVAAKYEGGFIIRENEHGRSSVYFDYRIVAHPHGASDARLPQLNLKPPPIPHIPQHVQPRQP